MKAKNQLAHVFNALAIALASAVPAAHAATDGYGQTLTLTPNADETQMALYWYPVQDDFSPATPCNLRPYTLTVNYDNAMVATFNQNNAPLSGTTGDCSLQRTLTIGNLSSSKIAPGVWRATGNRENWPQISESRTIFACTANQGKQPMYWTRNAAYTDNFYTLSASQRDTSLTIGYSNRGTAFAMPTNRIRNVSKPFYRYYKGAPQFEHFYTYFTPEWQFVEQNGYLYEGIEGYVYENYKPGTVALRRFTLFNPANSDLQHLYSINRNDPYAAGMTYEGIVGYVCPP